MVTVLTYLAMTFVLLLPFALFIGLAAKSELLFRDNSLGQLLFSSQWRPSSGEFGFEPFIVGSLYVTLIAMLISAPVCFLSAIHITQYAPRKAAKIVVTAIDILAGIPSVVYGVWGMVFVVPWLGRIAASLGIQSNGYSILAGGIVLSIMVIPFILNILMEIYRTIPKELTEVSLSLGATRWETIRDVLNRKALLSDEGKLKRMLVAMVDAAGDVPVVAPLRKPAYDVVAGFGLPSGSFFAIEPLPYLEFGYLSAHAMGIVTDSGNVAEEATFNNIPCATLNSYTEHIETVSQGSNVLVGEDAVRLGQAVGEMVAGKWKKCSLPDRWDGRTAERIVRILAEMK